jgi:hypothetical protein
VIFYRYFTPATSSHPGRPDVPSFFYKVEVGGVESSFFILFTQAFSTGGSSSALSHSFSPSSVV